MARHEPKFNAAAESKLHAEELLALLGEARSNCDRERQDAIACYLKTRMDVLALGNWVLTRRTPGTEPKAEPKTA